MVQCFGRKRHAVAVAVCKAGKGLIRLNGAPLHLLEPSVLRIKVMEPCLVCVRRLASRAAPLWGRKEARTASD